jgi:hypothetical protein
MPKAFRTDVLGHQKFQGEVGTLKKSQKSERVLCPTEGCACSYEMFGALPTNREANVTLLQERVQKEHPSHTSEVLAVNQFRKPLRAKRPPVRQSS